MSDVRSETRNVRTSRTPAALAFALVLIAFCGCGTRVVTNAGAAGNGTTAGTVDSGIAGSGPTSGVGSPTGAGQSIAGSAGSGASVGPGGGGVSGPGSVGGVGHGGVLGVTGTTIQIGYPYSQTAPLAAFSAACAACASFGNQTYFPQLFNEIAKDINGRGGVLGHKVVFQGYGYNSTAAASDSSQLAQFVQLACQHFTRDVPVFAVVFFALEPEPLGPCLTKSRVSLLAPAVMEEGSALNANLIYAPGAPLADTFERVFVQRLVAQHFFSGWNTTSGGPGTAAVKVGVVSFSDPGWAPSQRQFLLRALKNAGYKVDPQDDIAYSAELDTQSQNVQSAILKFRADNVTHVLGSAANGLFAYESVGQNYFPRYGWREGFGNDMNARSDQALRGAMGVGVFPVADIDPAQKPPSVGPLQKRCEQLATRAGVGWQSSQDVRLETLTMCDSIWTMVNALQKSRLLTPAGLARGYEQLGSGPSTFAFSETWGVGRHASTGAVQDIRFEPSCTCFRYTGVVTKF